MRKAMILAVLAALLATGCATTASHGVARHDRHPTVAAHDTCPKLAAGRKPQASGVLLGPGHIGTRTQVPWAKVGPGWILAQYSASGVPDSSARPKLGPVSLYLIDPAGGRYLMYRWASRQGQSLPGLVDWSPDASRALFEQQPNSAGYPPTRVLQLTLATGKVTRFDLPWNVYPQVYTNPDGQAVLATSGNQQVRLVKYCLTGRRGPILASAEDLGFAQSAVGTVAVSGTTGISLVSSTGRIIRRLPIPGARPSPGGCGPIRWWNRRTVLVACAQRGLWLVPSDGAVAHQLSPARGGHGADPYGDAGAWKLPSGLYLQAIGACSQLYIVKQLATGTIKAINIPGTYGNNNQIIGALGTRLLVRAQTGCPGSDSLLWFDPATRAVQMLLPAPRDVSGVLGAIPYGRPSVRL